MSRMASRRAAVTCPSRSSIALWSAGGMVFSAVPSLVSGKLAPVLSEAGLSGPAFAAQLAPARRTSVAVMTPAVSQALFVVLVLIRPVLGLEGPVLLVVAHETLELQGREHVGWIPSLAQVRDLDLELLLLADDGVDLREARLAQHLAQPRVEVEQGLLGDGARRRHEAAPQHARLVGQRLRRDRLARVRSLRAHGPRRAPRRRQEIAHAILHVGIAFRDGLEGLDVPDEAHGLARLAALGLAGLFGRELVPHGDLPGQQ